MTAPNQRNALIAFGRQSAEGTALSAPKFEIPLGSGSAGPAREIDDLPWAFDNARDKLGHFVSQVSGVIDWTDLPLLPKSAPALLYAVLGALATSGAGPYSQVATPANTIPFMTAFFQQPGPQYHKLADAKFGRLELGFDSGGPLLASVAGLAKTPTRSGSKWSAASVVESPVSAPFYRYAGATMLLDVASTPASSQVHSIGSGSLVIDNNLEGDQTDGYGFAAIDEGDRDITLDLTDVRLEDSNLINTIFFGSSSGTDVSTVTQYGSIDFTFLGSDAAAGTVRKMQITIPRLLFTVSAVPGADASGGPAKYDISAEAAKPSSGAMITATFLNDETGANY